MYIVYRQVFQIPWILHFEPSLVASSLQSGVMSSMNDLPQMIPGHRDGTLRTLGLVPEYCRAACRTRCSFGTPRVVVWVRELLTRGITGVPHS